MRNAFSSLLLIAALVVPQSARAIDLSERWEVGAQLGGMLIDNSSNKEPHMLSGGRVGYYLDDTWSVEGSLLAGPIDVKNPTDDGDADVIIPMVEGLYHLNSDQLDLGDDNLRPFLAAGLGAVVFDGAEGADDGHFGMNLGGGLKWFLTDNIAARVDGRWLLNTEGGAELNEATLTGGISWVTDGPATEPAPRKEKPRTMPEAAATLEREGKVSVDLRVNFDFDKSEIKAPYEPRLQEFAQFMGEHPGTTAEIEGHTDSVGTKEYNDRLSMRRANAIVQWLVSKGGVDRSRLHAAGYGFSRPVAPNSTAEGRAQNRRVIGTVRK